MQYLLTEEEFRALKDTKRDRDNKDASEMQAFCTLAAMHIPIPRPWSDDKTPAPWGCILGAPQQNPGYCDECPAQKACPYPHKEWSQ